MTNDINQKWKPATAPRNSDNEVVKSKPYNAKRESPETVPNNQGWPNETLPKQSPGSTTSPRQPGVESKSENPAAVPGGAVPSTPGAA